MIFLTHTPEARRHYYGEQALNGLRALGPLRCHDGAEPLDTRGLTAAAMDAQVIVADRATAVPAAVVQALPGLAAVVRCAVDIRNIDVAAASAAGVLVTRAGPGFVDAVTELAVGFLVDLSRGISRSVTAWRAGQVPAVAMGRQLAGSTIGIIGYGRIGRRLAQVVAALGMRVLAADPHPEAADRPLVPLAELLAAADYVVCLAAATAATENLIDAAAFAAMRPGACFLNLARGNLVDEAALAAALESGRLAGAALDVGRAPDQMPSPDLARRPDVIATPHIGGLTPPAIEAQALETVRQVAAILAGTAPPGSVNAECWTRALQQ